MWTGTVAEKRELLHAQVCPGKTKSGDTDE